MTKNSTQIFPPPTNESDFENALRRGLGRAVLWLQSGAVTPDRDLILRACRENWAFDSVSEGNRALYMSDVIAATGEPDFYVPRIIEALLADQEGDSFSQLFELTGLLAAAGRADARAALYAAFTRAESSRDYYLAAALLRLDGLEGYLFTIRAWLRIAPEDDNYSVIHLFDDAQNQFGEDAVAEAMDLASHTDPAIAEYHTSAKELHAGWKARITSRSTRPNLTYEELRALAATPSRRKKHALWARRGRRMDDETAKRIAADLSSETDYVTLAHLLCLFGDYEFPGDPEILFTLAESKIENVASAAVVALAAVIHPRVRQLGLAIMDGNNEPWAGVTLLKFNFEPGDCRAMERLVDRLNDPDAIHWLGMEVREIFDENPAQEFAKVLTQLYEKGMCAMCRSSVIDGLAQLGRLTANMRAECRYDAYDETRWRS